MNLKKVLYFGKYLIMDPIAFIAKKRYIFIFSHMRSYSSLLCHILGSHPEISGYVENELNYCNKVDFLKLKLKVYSACDGLKGRYVFDKMLHRFQVSDKYLTSSNIKKIITVRKPERTIKSMVSLFSSKTGNYEQSSPQGATQYYINRLIEIQQLAKRMGGKGIFFESESLVDDTDNILERLSAYLELKKPLESKYKTFKYTGQARKGDTSEFIKKGNIQRNRKEYSEIVIPENLIEKANNEYNKCIKYLKETVTFVR